MRYLTDTHIFLWALFEPGNISPKAQKILRSQESSVFVSVVSFWEISLKYALGKLELQGIEPHELPDFALQTHFEILDLQPEDAAFFDQLPRFPHKDPFGRMIIWQAVRNKMTLISKDREFAEYQKIGLRII
jgi:PIN domain nuclease of toxin-antitoxin system